MMQLVQIFEATRRIPDFWEGRSAVIDALRAQVDTAEHLFAHESPICQPVVVNAVQVSVAVALRKQMLATAMDDRARPAMGQEEAFGRAERARLLHELDLWLAAKGITVPALPEYVQVARRSIGKITSLPEPAGRSGSWTQ